MTLNMQIRNIQQKRSHPASIREVDKHKSRYSSTTRGSAVKDMARMFSKMLTLNSEARKNKKEDSELDSAKKALYDHIKEHGRPDPELFAKYQSLKYKNFKSVG